MQDIIIVGARCAGAMTARLLAQKGYRVLMIDVAEAFTDSILANFICPPGAHQLRKWGLLSKIAEGGCPILNVFSTDYGDFPLASSPHPWQGHTEMISPRRKFLDPLLLDSALEAGVQFWPGFRAERLLWEDSKVVGLQGKNNLGQAAELRAPLVIGADGKNSWVAKQVQASQEREVPTQTFSYFAYFAGLPKSYVGVGMHKGHSVYFFPTHEDLSMVGVFWRIESFPEIRKDFKTHFYAYIQKYPWLADVVCPKNLREGFYGHADSPNFFRKPYGTGWALVGDAAYHRDPLSGFGLSDAFRDVELLTVAIEDFFSGKKSYDEAFASYEDLRRLATEETYQFTLRSTLLDPGEKLQPLRQAIKNQPEQSAKFHGMFTGTYSPQKFFSKENIKKIFS